MVTLTATMGHKGRVVVPQVIRERRGWDVGQRLVVSEDESGIRLCSPDEALALFRRSVQGTSSPVEELIVERRREAKSDLQ